MEIISSFSNKAVKEINALNKKASYRREKGLFTAEGEKIFSEIPDELVDKVFISESCLKNISEAMKFRLFKLPYLVMKDEVFRSVCDTKTPQGILVTAKRLSYTLEDILLENPDAVGRQYNFLIILENIQDPGNLGTIIRSSEGAGVTGIIMSADTADIYNPKVIRATMGSIFRVPFIYVKDFNATIEKIKAKGIETYAADINAEEAYDKFDFKKSLAFLVGNEANGLSEESLALVKYKLKIPMSGSLESLNAAVACAILMYEAARQRRNIL